MSTNPTVSQDRPAVDYALLVVRVIVGIIFAAHGAQKLFGAFGGTGLAATVEQMGPIGYLIVIGEFGGGAGLIIGFLCRFSAASLIVILIGAIAWSTVRTGSFSARVGSNTTWPLSDCWHRS